MGVYGCTPIFGECPLLYNKGMFVAIFWISYYMDYSRFLCLQMIIFSFPTIPPTAKTRSQRKRIAKYGVSDYTLQYV